MGQQEQHSDGPQGPRTGRRRLLRLGGIAAAGGAAGVALSATPASAAAGGAVLLGRVNSAGTAGTSLSTASSSIGLSVHNTGAGPGAYFRADHSNGFAGGTASGSSYGLSAANTGAAGSGAGLAASGGNNVGAIINTDNEDQFALRVTNRSDFIPTNAFQSGAITVDAGGGTGVDVVAWFNEGAAATLVHAGDLVDGDTTPTTLYAASQNGIGALISGAENGAIVLSDQANGVGLFAVDATQGKTGRGLVVDGDTQLRGNVSIVANGQGPAKGDVTIAGDLHVAGTIYAVGGFVTGAVTLGTTRIGPAGTAEVTVAGHVPAGGTVAYQLTSIGAPAPDLHVSGELEAGRFRIAGGVPGSEVSWQVTTTPSPAVQAAAQTRATAATEHGAARWAALSATATRLRARTQSLYERAGNRRLSARP